MTDNAETNETGTTGETTEIQGDGATVQPENENNSGADTGPTIEGLTAENDDLRANIADLQAQLAEANAKADKAEKKAASAKAGVKPAKVRKAAEIDTFDAIDLLKLIGAAETVEVVFSDGKKEVAALSPLVIEGGAGAWKVRSDGRLQLALPQIIIEPVGATSVAGYGLFLDGDQVAWSQRMETLTIANGQKINITDDILF